MCGGIVNFLICSVPLYGRIIICIFCICGYRCVIWLSLNGLVIRLENALKIRKLRIGPVHGIHNLHHIHCLLHIFHLIGDIRKATLVHAGGVRS